MKVSNEQYKEAASIRIYSKRFLRFHKKHQNTNEWFEEAWIEYYVDWSILLLRVTGR